MCQKRSIPLGLALFVFASALIEQCFDVVFLSQELFLTYELLSVILSKEMNRIRITASAIANIAGRNQIVLPVRSASCHWHEMVKNEILFGKWCRAIDTGVTISGQYSESPFRVAIIITIVFQWQLSLHLKFFPVYYFATRRNVAW